MRLPFHYHRLMAAGCAFKERATDKPCGAEARWIADVGWAKDTSAYEGTSWSVSLCELHYERLRAEGMITGTAHEVPAKSKAKAKAKAKADGDEPA